MSTRTTCGACNGEQLVQFLDLGKTPLANKFPTTEQCGHEKWYPLGLTRCANCGLVQGIEIIPDEEIYGDDYGFFSGGSAAQLEYHKAGAELLAGRFLAAGSLRANQPIVEVACNDGSLLTYFDRWGYDAIGVDPALPAQKAREDGLDVIVEPFTAALGRKIRDERGAAGLVIAYNSLAHVGDLSDVMTGIWALLSPEGRAVVEVQYLPDLLAGNMYDQVYHEHRYFHSLTSFKHVAELHQLRVVDAELIELQGGGVRFTLASDPDAPVAPSVPYLLAKEAWLADPGAYSGVQGRIDRIADHLVDLLDAEIARGRKVAGYAAAAKATTILNYCGIGPDRLPYVVDTTPYKAGRFVPGTNIPIFATGSADTYLLLAPNYLSHVLRSFDEFRKIGGRWLTPLPAPTLI